MAGEVEAEGLVVVENRGVYGAVEESEYGVRRRGNYCVLHVRHGKVVVGLEDGARGHGWVVDYLLVGINQ